MARWATTCIIGSEDFSECRVNLINPYGFKNNKVGSADWGNDGTVHIQTLIRGKKGIQFGLKFETTESSRLLTVLNAAESGDLIQVTVVEDIYDIDVMCVPDYTKGDEWFTHGGHSEGWYEDVSLYWISKVEA